MYVARCQRYALSVADISDLSTAKNVHRLIKKKNLLQWRILEYRRANVQIRQQYPDGPVTNDEHMAYIYRESPKIKTVMDMVAQLVVLEEKKLLIFCTIPAQQALVFAMLQAANVSCAVYHGALSSMEKGVLQKQFNKSRQPMVMIGTFQTMSHGLNLQHQCHHEILLDPPPSLAWFDQTAARIHRLGQDETCFVVMLSAEGTFNDRIMMNNIRKAVPATIARIFRWR
jgi:SNF2 family DNA or RNA helicase